MSSNEERATDVLLTDTDAVDTGVKEGETCSPGGSDDAQGYRVRMWMDDGRIMHAIVEPCTHAAHSVMQAWCFWKLPTNAIPL